MISGTICKILKGISGKRKDLNATYILINIVIAIEISSSPIIDKNRLVSGVNSMIQMDLGIIKYFVVATKDCINFILYEFSTISKKILRYKILLHNNLIKKNNM